ncbi:hypothetical protein AMD01_21375 [Priestia koreensis]|uniref:Uncharacterized protein n=1 Tax=Priestia koreensis TaxID=284581 RepID=A0A0M0KNG3_9BACI|nr:hypothetical protein AMD01_21375 [Priestia koreensis]
MSFGKTSKNIVITKNNVELSAYENNGRLMDFILKKGNKKLSFPTWKNVSNPTYSPQLLSEDINNDGLKEVIVILTTGYGSGVLFQEVHVFNENKEGLFDEVKVEDALEIVKDNVKTNLTNSTASIIIGDKDINIDISKFPFDPQRKFENVAFGSITQYKVLNHSLVAEVSATVAPDGGYIGDISILYKLKRGTYQAGKIKFTPTIIK